MQKITWEKIRDVFYAPTKELKYKYLGYVYNPYKHANYYAGKVAEAAIWDFIELVDTKAKRWWTPRWFLRLLHLYGNDNSIIRMRNLKVHNLHRKLTRGYLITDIKTKWDSSDVRVYGSFDDECYEYLKRMEKLILNAYKEDE